MQRQRQHGRGQQVLASAGGHLQAEQHVHFVGDVQQQQFGIAGQQGLGRLGQQQGIALLAQGVGMHLALQRGLGATQRGHDLLGHHGRVGRVDRDGVGVGRVQQPGQYQAHLDAVVHQHAGGADGMVDEGASAGAVATVEQADGQQQGIGQVLQFRRQVAALAGLVQQARGGLFQVGTLHGLAGVAGCLQAGAQRAGHAHMLVHECTHVAEGACVVDHAPALCEAAQAVVGGLG